MFGHVWACLGLLGMFGHVWACLGMQAAKPEPVEAPPAKRPRLSGDIFASLRTRDVIKNARNGFIIVDGEKYTVKDPHPQWKYANRGGKNRFTGVTCDKGKKGNPPRLRPWKVNFCNKTVGRFETILQAVHARLLKKRQSFVDLTTQV